jgi:hypothetical protein
MKKSLTRSIPYWLLVALSLASAAVGGWVVSDNTATMTARLLDGTATGVEVYVGQPWIVVGAVLVGAGVIGVLLALTLAAAKSLVPTAAPAVVEPIDWSAQPDDVSDASTSSADGEADAVDDENVDDDEGQNGSSGSTATATKISVR